MIEGQMVDAERKFITEHICRHHPRLVLECGTWKGGGSTLAVLKGLAGVGRGHLHTFEINKSFYDQAVADIRTHYWELAQFATFHHGDFVTGAPGAGRGPVSLVILDGSGDTSRLAVDCFNAVKPRLSHNATVICHDWRELKQRELKKIFKSEGWKIQEFDWSHVGMGVATCNRGICWPATAGGGPVGQ